MKSYDRVKNFSTSVPVERTILEIEKMLTKYGASHIMKSYHDDRPVMIIFGIETEHGKLAIRLPVKPDKMLMVFKKQVSDGLLSKKYWDGDWAVDQAHRVSWRILKDWLDAQLTLLNIEMVSLQEIFLPYVYSEKLDMTVYELLEKKEFDFELLTP